MKRLDDELEAKRQNAEAIITAWERDVLAAVLAVPDEVDRTLRLRAIRRDFHHRELQAIVDRPVSQQEMADWFVRVVPGQPPERRIKRYFPNWGGLGYWHKVRPNVWIIGNTSRLISGTEDYDQPRYFAAAITADGHLMAMDEEGRLRRLQGGETIGQLNWFRAAKRPALKIPPSPGWAVYEAADR